MNNLLAPHNTEIYEKVRTILKILTWTYNASKINVMEKEKYEYMSWLDPMLNRYKEHCSFAMNSFLITEKFSKDLIKNKNENVLIGMSYKLKMLYNV